MNKHTKKALFASVLSLLLCVSMLVGTTFAWFTDSVTTGVNTIQSGTLDVDLVDAQDNSLQGKSLKFEAIDGRENDKILWEPGCRYKLEDFKIVNNGTLALKYQVFINGLSGDVKLLEAIDFTVSVTKDGNTTEIGDLDAWAAYTKEKPLNPGEDSGVISILGVMDPAAGNEYQDLKVENVSIVVYATQYTKESDSIDDQYDKDASIADAIFAFGGVYEMDADRNGRVDISENANVTINAGDESITNSVTNNGNLVINDGTIAVDDRGLTNNGKAELNDVTVNAGTAGTYSNVTEGKEAVTVYNDVTVSSGGGGIGVVDGASVVFNGGSVEVDSTSTSGRYLFYLEGEGSNLVINGGNFDFNKTQNQKRAYIYAGEGTTVTVNGGTFGKASTRSGYTAGILGTGTVLIKGGTFGFDPTTWVAEGYKAEKNGEVWKVVPATSNNTEFAGALAAGNSTIALGAGTFKVPDAAKNKKVTIVGTPGTVIDVSNGLTYINGSEITFEGVTIKSTAGTGYNYGFADAKNTVFNNCVIEGTLGLDYSCEFNNCTFNVSGNNYNLWTWGAGTASFTGCTFNCDGKALLVYANVLDNGTTHQTVNITDCVFNDNGDDTVTGKAAIEITNTYTPIRTYDVIIKNTTVNGFAQTVPGAGDFNAAYGSVTGSALGTNVWGNKCQLPNTQINVVIDGVDVY